MKSNKNKNFVNKKIFTFNYFSITLLGIVSYFYGKIIEFRPDIRSVKSTNPEGIFDALSVMEYYTAFLFSDEPQPLLI